MSIDPITETRMRHAHCRDTERKLRAEIERLREAVLDLAKHTFKLHECSKRHPIIRVVQAASVCETSEIALKKSDKTVVNAIAGNGSTPDAGEG